MALCRLPMLPRRPLMSGLARPKGSGVRRGLRDSGVELRRGLRSAKAMGDFIGDAK